MDWYWRAKIGEWITVITQIAGVVAALGITWNAVQVLLEYTVFGSGRVVSAIIYRVIGIVLALMLVVEAPKIVNDLEPYLKAPLIQ